jgi:DNA-binding MarR family transcriptional regulator
MENVDLVGQKLFGRKLRLSVALWILRRDEPTFFQSEAADGVGYTASAVTDELDRFIALGMLLERSAEAGDRRKYYERVDSPLWKIIETAKEVLEA